MLIGLVLALSVIAIPFVVAADYEVLLSTTKGGAHWKFSQEGWSSSINWDSVEYTFIVEYYDADGVLIPATPLVTIYDPRITEKGDLVKLDFKIKYIKSVLSENAPSGTDYYIVWNNAVNGLLIDGVTTFRAAGPGFAWRRRP